jgi:hypothetical protein
MHRGTQGEIAIKKQGCIAEEKEREAVADESGDGVFALE